MKGRVQDAKLAAEPRSRQIKYAEKLREALSTVYLGRSPLSDGDASDSGDRRGRDAVKDGPLNPVWGETHSDEDQGTPVR